MMGEIASLMGATYDALGPGLLTVAALPVFLVALGVVLGVAKKRFGRSEA